MTKEQVVTMAQRHLENYKPSGVSIEVVTENIRDDAGFWYIPVRLMGELPRRYRYYEDLAGAEEEILNEESLNVLFVPTGSAP